MAKQATIAPVYRYFTADLLTNKILAEIPLRGVSYECALKAAGRFSGSIPVTAETDSMDLHNTTMPGNTALYVVRNGKCVWGGIIWSRQYVLPDNSLQISASEFPSYFYHRKIWKTWNHQHGGTVTYDETNGWRVVFDSGSNLLAKAGSTVKLEFYETENWKYNGYYRVKSDPPPTLDGFSIVSGFSVADITSGEKGGGWWTYYTKENHGYNTGDAVTLTITSVDGELVGSPAATEHVVDAPYGPDSNVFRVSTSAGTEPLTVIEGTVARTLPAGTYHDVTVTIRLDTFDYVRGLIDSMFEDFVGTDFPNIYIEPGISYAFDIVSKQAIDGYAILETEQPHGIAPGQAIQVRDVGGNFDGEFEVTDTPDPNVLVYAAGGSLGYTSVGILETTISNLQMDAGIATVGTVSAHGFTPGQTVEVFVGDAYGDFNGSWTILDTPSTTRFRYQTNTDKSYQFDTLLNARGGWGGVINPVVRASITNNVATIEFDGDVSSFSPGGSLSIADTPRYLPILEKALDAPNSVASIQTNGAHGLKVGDSVKLVGLGDFYKIVTKNTTTSTVTMTTETPHNLRVGQSVSIRGLDTYNVVAKQLSSGVAKLTTATNHNIPVGATITVSDIRDIVNVTAKRMEDGVATLTTATNNIQVNDTVFVTGLTDTYAVVSKEAVDGLVTLTTSVPHNLLVGEKIKVSGVGVPFDTPEIEVQNITATRIMYRVDEKYWDEQKATAAKKGQNLKVPMTVPLSKSAGSAVALNSFFNGQYVVSARTNTSVSFQRSGHDMAQVSASGKIDAPSFFNGTYTVTATTNNTVSYARAGNNMSSATVPAVVNPEDPQPMVSLNTIHDGNKTITAVTSNTFTFVQSSLVATSHPVALTARIESVFNGVHTVASVPTSDRFTFGLPGYSASVMEQVADRPAFAIAPDIYNGTHTITAVDTVRRTISYALTRPDYASSAITRRGVARVHPAVIISSFGPFPGNANIMMGYDTQKYTGINVEPTAYRGFELKSVGEALDAYSDNINGFEYRIDCDYDEENDRFIRTFVLVPINKPNPPAPGTVSPITRFGADKLIFEYPGGSIIGADIEESAEESATRFFAVGSTDLGPEAGPNIGIASANDLLNGTDGRKWPLLDASEQIDGVEDENELYAHAQRYLSEAAPPYTSLNVTLNGSIAPFVGDYKPGDWCSLHLNDPWIRMRLASDLEPRNDVIVRKIASYTVRVPDGVTYPETVSLNLVAEWEVDTRGK